MQENRTHPSRLESLDAFRGITVAGMILVNTPGSWSYVYAPLRHAEWHGWTPTDLVFPFFLFIVGTAMSFSLRAVRDRGVSRARVFEKILIRSLIIVALGLFLNGFPRFDLEHWRVPGVLQRIGVVYFCAASLTLALTLRGIVLVTVGLLLGYWALLMWIPTPTGIVYDLSPEGNLGAHLDRAVFGAHQWKKRWDPEGLLSTLPAIDTALLGYLLGELVGRRGEQDRRELVGWLFVVGWAAALLGLFWDAGFPINKSLWTSSFVLLTAGAAAQLFAACYFLIDVMGYRRWAKPVVAIGMNPLLIYVGSSLLVRLMMLPIPTNGGPINAYGWTYHTLFKPWAGDYNGSLLFACTHVVLWFGVAWLLHTRRVFVKI